jgi:hypothetical protein
MSPAAEQAASSGTGALAEIDPNVRGSWLSRRPCGAALVARGVRHAELLAVVNQKIARLVGADAAALPWFEPDEDG